MWTFAVAEPLFNVIDASFFTLASRLDAIVWALAVAFFVPATLFLLELVVERLWPRALYSLHFFLIFGLAAVLVSRLVATTASPSSAVQTIVAVAGGALLALLYRRFSPLRDFLTVLAPAPIVFLLIFAWSPETRAAMTGEEGIEISSPPAGAPVVLIVFDELPVTSLMDASGRIDPLRFPNFAALAKGSTWFRNATTVHSATSQAVPTILTGRESKVGSAATAPAHPESIFTALGGTYAMHVREGFTRICPEKVCRRIGLEGHRARLKRLFDVSLPVSLKQWLPAAAYRRLYPLEGTPGDPGDQLRGLLPDLEPSGPTFHFAHVLLPHQPWRFLPSGKTYPYERSDLERLGPVSLTDTWSNPDEARSAYKAHLLQLGYTDKLLGEALERMRATGLYDQALVIVVADHGISFRSGQSARVPSRENAADLLSVPFFVKAPGQRTAKVSDRFVRTTDVPATIADGANTKLSFSHGQSALGRSFRGPSELNVSAGDFGSASLTTAAFESGRDAGLRRLVSSFPGRFEDAVRTVRNGRRVRKRN